MRGATGKVGDPSGRTSARAEMVQQERIRNIENSGHQLKRFFQNGKEYYLRKRQQDNNSNNTNTTSNKNHKSGKHFVLNNLDWWKDVEMLDFLTTYGKYI